MARAADSEEEKAFFSTVRKRRGRSSGSNAMRLPVTDCDRMGRPARFDRGRVAAQANLAEEEATDKKLTRLAKASANTKTKG